MRSVGQYKHRVRIQRKTVTPSAMGPQETWADIQTRWARVTTIGVQTQAALSNARFQEVGYGKSTHIIFFRGEVNLIYGTDRFVYDGRIFEMSGPLKDPEGRGCNTIVAVNSVPQNVES